MNKQILCSLMGAIGGAAAWAFGGWDKAMIALVVCISVDYISGSIVALVFHRSTKTESGAYNSAYGLKGLCKKGLMLLFVMIAVQIDQMLDSTYVRDTVCIGFSINEILSIVENLGHAGVPMPAVITKALEQLQSKNG